MYFNQNLSDHKKPNLLVVGFPRSGTSSLFQYLAAHPCIAVPLIKETYFLVDKDSPFKQEWGSIHESEELFARFLLDYRGERYILDATPVHFCQQTALEYAANDLLTKVIFIVREPAERIYSSYSYIKHVLQELPKLTFAKFVEAMYRKGVDSFHSELELKGILQFELTLGIEAGHYVEHLNKWIDALDKNRLLILNFAELRDNPLQLMRRICTFLDLDDSCYQKYDFGAYNKSFTVRFSGLQKWLRRIAGLDPMKTEAMGSYHSNFHFISSLRVKNIVDLIYHKLQIIPGDVLLPEDKLAFQKLIDYYKPYNQRLHQEFNISFIDRS